MGFWKEYDEYLSTLPVEKKVYDGDTIFKDNQNVVIDSCDYAIYKSITFTNSAIRFMLDSKVFSGCKFVDCMLTGDLTRSTFHNCEFINCKFGLSDDSKVTFKDCTVNKIPLDGLVNPTLIAENFFNGVIDDLTILNALKFKCNSNFRFNDTVIPVSSIKSYVTEHIDYSLQLFTEHGAKVSLPLFLDDVFDYEMEDGVITTLQSRRYKDLKEAIYNCWHINPSMRLSYTIQSLNDLLQLKLLDKVSEEIIVIITPGDISSQLNNMEHSNPYVRELLKFDDYDLLLLVAYILQAEHSVDVKLQKDFQCAYVEYVEKFKNKNFIKEVQSIEFVPSKNTNISILLQVLYIPTTLVLKRVSSVTERLELERFNLEDLIGHFYTYLKGNPKYNELLVYLKNISFKGESSLKYYEELSYFTISLNLEESNTECVKIESATWLE